MKVGFVVQRYGLEVNGGAEMECRQIAEHLTPYIDVEVLTTCAKDYMTWENIYAPGVEQVNGVTVRRFAVERPRDLRKFNRASETLFQKPRTHDDEINWMRLQGPDSPDLLNYLQTQADKYDLFLFFTYLYATTYFGLQIVKQKSMLFPTAHDEIWIKLGLFDELFQAPVSIIFNAIEEQAFVWQRFGNQHIPSKVLGVGIDVPSVRPKVSVHLDDYILYVGRIDGGKGCKELFEYFSAFKDRYPSPLKLALIGTQAMPVPERDDVVFLGFMRDERFEWMQRAKVVLMPSPHESLSLVTLEAWQLGVPMLVNGQSEVLRGHCRRGNGGLYYHDGDEFCESLDMLLSDARLRTVLGQQGQRYVAQQYQWPRVTQGYLDFFDQTLERVKLWQNNPNNLLIR